MQEAAYHSLLQFNISGINFPSFAHCHSGDILNPSLDLNHLCDLYSRTLQLDSSVSHSTCGDSSNKSAACLD